MVIIKDFSTTWSLHGILRYFYDQGEDYYANNLEYSATSYADVKIPANAFNFSNTEYWYPELTQEGLKNLSFCLTNYYAMINGFELLTSSLNARPQRFMFSSSFNNDSYSNFQEYSHEYSRNESNYFPYRTKTPVKCFKLTTLNGTENSSSFDVVNIEIYGAFSSNINHLFRFTCHVTSNLSSSHLFLSMVFIIL